MFDQIGPEQADRAVTIDDVTPDCPHILLVEDNDLNRDMLGRRLSRCGFQLSYATDGWSAVRLASEVRPDLILMDLSLPEIDGWEATRILKARDQTRAIPVIALTANAMTTDRDNAFSAGCDDYEIKPINFAKLLSKITKFID